MNIKDKNMISWVRSGEAVVNASHRLMMYEYYKDLLVKIDPMKYTKAGISDYSAEAYFFVEEGAELKTLRSIFPSLDMLELRALWWDLHPNYQRCL